MADVDSTAASTIALRSGLEAALAARVFDALADAVVVIDTDAKVIGWSSGATQLFGYTTSEALGRPLRELVVPVDRGNEFAMFQDLVEAGRTIRVKSERRSATGEVLNLDLHVSAVFDDDGTTIATIASYRPIIEDTAPAGSVHVDPLTGAATRAGLAAALDVLLAQRTRNTLAAAFIDLDGFKAINDQHGHQVGDEVLVEAARRLMACVRQGDVVARLGGDEFVVLVNDVDDEGVDAFVARLLERFDQPVEASAATVWLGASLGVRTVRPGEDVDTRAVLHDADLAMYDAKRRGKGQVVVFDDTIRSQYGRAVAMADGIRVGLRRNEFRPWYQPLVDLTTGDVVGAEALVRWHTEDGGVRPPADFLPMARRLGVIGELDRQTMLHACDELALWHRTPGLEALFVTINVTEVSLRHGAAEELRAALAERDLPPDRFCVEVTETAVGLLDAEALAEVEAMAELGVHIVVDDFGVAQASLSALRDLPLSFLKLDRRFVSSFIESVDDRAIVAATGSLAASLGTSAVAEGIEDVESVTPLIRYGYSVGQGYAFAPPVPDERFRELAVTGFPQIASVVDRDLRKRAAQTRREVSSTGSFMTDMARHLGLDTTRGRR